MVMDGICSRSCPTEDFSSSGVKISGSNTIKSVNLICVSYKVRSYKSKRQQSKIHKTNFQNPHTRNVITNFGGETCSDIMRVA